MLSCKCVEYYVIAMLTLMDPELLSCNTLYNHKQIHYGILLLGSMLFIFGSLEVVMLIS